METIIILIIFIFGAILGSFYACMGYRIPNKIKLTKPNSFCDNCKKPLKAYMNIPIFSYIFLRGKCAYCKKKISPLNFLIEVITGLLFVISYKLFGFDMNFFICLTLISALAVTIVSDFLYYYISDRVIIISLISIVIIKTYFLGIPGIKITLLNGIIAFIIMYLIKLLGNVVFKKESLGDGDIKLMLFIGSTLSLTQLVLSLGIASLTGLVFALFATSDDKNGIVPFGPFLIIGALITLFFNINII